MSEWDGTLTALEDRAEVASVCCTAEREFAEEAALARHREATASRAIPQEKNDNG